MPRKYHITLDGTPDEFDFATSQIIDGGYSPNPKEDWRGRNEVIEAVKAKFYCNTNAASDLVDKAVARLWSEKSNASVAAERRMILLELKRASQLLWKEMSGLKKTRYYEFKPKTENGKEVRRNGKLIYQKILKNERTTTQINPALMRLYIEVQDRRGVLTGVHDAAAGGD